MTDTTEATITSDRLARAGACDKALQLFGELFPDGAPLCLNPGLLPTHAAVRLYHGQHRAIRVLDVNDPRFYAVCMPCRYPEKDWEKALSQSEDPVSWAPSAEVK